MRILEAHPARGGVVVHGLLPHEPPVRDVVFLDWAQALTLRRQLDALLSSSLGRGEIAAWYCALQPDWRGTA